MADDGGPSHRYSWVAAVVTAAGLLVGTAFLDRNDTGLRTDPVRPTTAGPAASGSADPVPALAGGNRALWDAVRPGAVIRDTCRPATTWPGTTGQFSCTTDERDATVTFARFATGGDRARVVDGLVRLIVRSAPNCNTGGEYRGTWADAKDTVRGPLLCYYDTDGRYTIVWAYYDLDLVASVVSESPSQARRWFGSWSDFLVEPAD